MLTPSFFKNIRYYSAYQLMYVVMAVILTSIGAFFHFLLDHEISIVESWLHNSHWEILIISKVVSLFFLNRWFTMRLYQLKTFRELVKQLVGWPDAKAVVIAIFILISYLSLAQVSYVGQNFTYWYYHFTSFMGLFLFFGIEFIAIAYIDDLLTQKETPSKLHTGLAYTVIFTLSYRLSVPDYYGLLPYVVFCYSTLVYLSGRSFRNWSNVMSFLVIFVAPMGAFFGLDPVWGEDFSLFHVHQKLNLAFLAVVWVVSFSYYKYRELFLNSARKLLR
jgi:hypothetical protein